MADELIDISSAFPIDFVATHGLTLLPGHIVNLVKNGSDIQVDVNTDCNIYSGLFTEKRRETHEYKYKRNTVRFHDLESLDEYVPYENRVTFYEDQANMPYYTQTSDTAMGVKNTTITYSRIEEVIMPERAYYWEYEGAECTRPDIVNMNTSYGYYISSIQYGTVSHFEFAINTEELEKSIRENICTEEQELEFKYATYPEPECILKDTALKNIDLDCSSKCESDESIDSCQENEIGDHLVAAGLISFMDFKDILFEHVYNDDVYNDISSNDEVSSLELFNNDVSSYRNWFCAKSCAEDDNICTFNCFNEMNSNELFSKFHSYLIGLNRINEVQNDNILRDFQFLLQENYNQIRSNYCVQICFQECDLLKQKTKLDWNTLVTQYGNFVKPFLFGKMRVEAYPYEADSWSELSELVRNLETVAADKSKHRPLKIFLKKIPEIMIPGREDDFGPPSPEVGGIAIDFPDEENYFFNITLDNCQEEDCASGVVKRHQEDLLRNNVPVTTDYTWIWQNHTSKLVNVYFARFGEQLLIDPGYALSFTFNAVDISEIYLIYQVDADGGLSDKETNKAWRQSIPKWKCRDMVAGTVIGVGDLHGGTSKGEYHYCQYMTPKANGMVRLRTPVFQKEFRGFLAYTTPSISIDDMNANTTDVNGDPVVFVNPLPPAAKNDWFREVKINGTDVAYSEKKLFNDVPVTGFSESSDADFVLKLRRPGFYDNDFIKFEVPTVLETGSTIELVLDHDKLEAFKNFQYRLMIVSAAETHQTIDCPLGFKSMSPKAGIMNLGYNFNWNSKYARGCKKRIALSNDNAQNALRTRLSLTATSDWIIVISIYGHIKEKYLETTADNLIMRSANQKNGHQGRNAVSRVFRSGRIRAKLGDYKL